MNVIRKEYIPFHELFSLLITFTSFCLTVRSSDFYPSLFVFFSPFLLEMIEFNFSEQANYIIVNEEYRIKLSNMNFFFFRYSVIFFLLIIFIGLLFSEIAFVRYFMCVGMAAYPLKYLIELFFYANIVRNEKNEHNSDINEFLKGDEDNVD